MYFEDTYFLNNPAHKTKWTEEMAPWTVYEETGNEDRSDKYPAIDRDNRGFINFKRIDSTDNIKTPRKSNNSKSAKRGDTNCVGHDKRKFYLKEHARFVVFFCDSIEK